MILEQQGLHSCEACRFTDILGQGQAASISEIAPRRRWAEDVVPPVLRGGMVVFRRCSREVPGEVRHGAMLFKKPTEAYQGLSRSRSVVSRKGLRASFGVLEP